MPIFYSLQLNFLFVGMCGSRGRSKMKGAELPWKFKFWVYRAMKFRFRKGGPHSGVPRAEVSQDAGLSATLGMVGNLRSESQMRYLKNHVPKHTRSSCLELAISNWITKWAEDVCKSFLLFRFAWSIFTLRGLVFLYWERVSCSLKHWEAGGRLSIQGLLVLTQHSSTLWKSLCRIGIISAFTVSLN